MGKLEVPPGWICQAYRFEVDRASRYQSIPSHEGARRFAWNWALGLIEEQLHARSTYRVLAIRQGASTDEADAYAEQSVKLQALVEMNEGRRKTHEHKVTSGERKSAYRPVSESVPWSSEAMRFIWNREKHEIAPWWSENSKECYTSAFEALSRAFKNCFNSRDGIRAGRRVGWPKYKRRGGRQSVSFTTGGIGIIDRHHIQLPKIGHLRVKESTDKLGLRLVGGTARILRATLTSDSATTVVSFSVLVQRDKPAYRQSGVCGHDVGISSIITGSDGHVVENTKPAEQIQAKVRRYQRRMDRQHRTGSPRCFNHDGTHVKGTCYWKTRSVRAKKNQRHLARTHSKASNIRKDTIHKASYRAATTYAINVVEDLNVGGMGRRGQGKRGFNDAVHDAALGEFRRQLTYKCSWHGSELWVADRWYPSSKLCSRCRMRNAGLLRSARVFRCERCGLVIDRDLNAAKNLAALTEFACVCLMAQLMTGEPVDWSSLPIRPSGWGPDKDTRSSRGSARAGGRKADGGERKTAQHSSAGDRSFHREVAVATGPVASLGGVSHSPKKAVV